MNTIEIKFILIDKSFTEPPNITKEPGLSAYI